MMPRPPQDDEVARQRFWAESLDTHGGDRREVIRSASQALALRDAHIVRLERQVSEQALSRRKDRKE